jgi:hypothetical protein
LSLVAVPAFAQPLTKDDVHKALVEHHTVLSSYCLATVFEDFTLSNNGDDATLVTRLLRAGHVESIPGTSQRVKLTVEGRKYVQSNTQMASLSGRLLHCFAIGKVSVAEVSSFRLIAMTTDAEVSYIIRIHSLPEWLKSVDIGTYRPDGPLIDWLVHVEKNNQTPRITGVQAVLVHANGRWMTNLMYERLSRGIR